MVHECGFLFGHDKALWPDIQEHAEGFDERGNADHVENQHIFVVFEPLSRVVELRPHLSDNMVVAGAMRVHRNEDAAVDWLHVTALARVEHPPHLRLDMGKRWHCCAAAAACHIEQAHVAWGAPVAVGHNAIGEDEAWTDLGEGLTRFPR
eukprot:scaffold150839_cov33-Tisochrysis_lutea.AAC.2